MLRESRPGYERHSVFVQHAIKHFGFNGAELLGMRDAQSLQDLGQIALDHIKGLGHFCTGIGPMTTGTNRTQDQNFEIFLQVYMRVAAGALLGPRSVFFQLPFEFDIGRIAEEYYDRDSRPEEFYKDLFRYFYGPIMLHEKLTVVWRMPEWEKSIGAREEFRILSQERSSPVTFHDALQYVPDLQKLLV